MTNDSQQSTVNESINRRNVLQIGGASLAGLTGAPQFVAASDGEQVEFVRYLKGNPPNREKVWDSVPFEHWAVRSTADDVRKQVQRRINHQWRSDSLLSPGFKPMPKSPTGFGVRVKYITLEYSDGSIDQPEPSVEEVRHKLPNTATGRARKRDHKARREGIPVVVHEKRFKKLDNCDGEGSTCQDFAGDYDPDMPGGLGVNYDGSTGAASVCAPFNHDDYGDGWIGSGHAAVLGNVVYYDPYSSDAFGTVRDYESGSLCNDWCFIDEDDSENAYAYIADSNADGSYDHAIGGIVTDSAIYNDVGTSTTYYIQGNSSCRLSGTVVEWDDPCAGTTHDTEAGDSGGVLFQVDEFDEAYIAGEIVAEYNYGSDEDGDDCGDDTHSQSAESIEFNAGGNFLTVGGI